jgi:hypothetical protein
MNITLEILKADEANLLAQLGQIQGALSYNRQQQAFLAKADEETLSAVPQDNNGNRNLEPSARI